MELPPRKWRSLFKSADLRDEGCRQIHAVGLPILCCMLGHKENALWGCSDEEAGGVDHFCLLHHLPVVGLLDMADLQMAVGQQIAVGQPSILSRHKPCNAAAVTNVLGHKLVLYRADVNDFFFCVHNPPNHEYVKAYSLKH